MRKRLAHLRPTLTASVAVLTVAVVVAGAVGGPVSALGAGVGVGIVAASFVISAVTAVWVDGVDRRLLLPVVLMTYVLKFAVLGVVAYTLQQRGWPGLSALAFGVVLATVVWLVTQVVWVYRSRIPYVDLNNS